jgi:Tol biopolymer transport system component
VHTVGGSRLTWSSDGKTLYFATNDGIARKAADGSGQLELVSKNLSAKVDPPDLDPGIRLEVSANAVESGYRVSPDRRWLAYSSSESGQSQIFIRGFPDERGEWQVSVEPGVLPQWRSDGKELFWKSRPGLERYLFAATVTPQANSLQIGKPERLFRVGSVGFPANSPDGRRFLLLEPPASSKELPMVLIRK